MIVFHGTKVKPEIILKEGLKPCVIDFKKYHGINTEIDDLIRRKKECFFVYLTSSYEEAHDWAMCGSNFINNLKLELGEKTLYERPGYIYLIELKIIIKGEFRVKYVPVKFIKSFTRIFS